MRISEEVVAVVASLVTLSIVILVGFMYVMPHLFLNDEDRRFKTLSEYDSFLIGCITDEERNKVTKETYGELYRHPEDDILVKELIETKLLLAATKKKRILKALDRRFLYEKLKKKFKIF